MVETTNARALIADFLARIEAAEQAGEREPGHQHRGGRL